MFRCACMLLLRHALSDSCSTWLYPSTSKHSRARHHFWMFKPMFDGSIQPKTLGIVFEASAVLWCLRAPQGCTVVSFTLRAGVPGVRSGEPLASHLNAGVQEINRGMPGHGPRDPLRSCAPGHAVGVQSRRRTPLCAPCNSPTYPPARLGR
jgi:hypothetical protein